MTTLEMPTGLSVVVNDGDLRFRVGTQPLRLAALANAGQLAAEPVREHDRRRHQFRRVVAGETEHQALVARALLGAFLALGLLRIHALGDVVRLIGDDGVDENLLRVKHVVVVHVTDFAHGIAHDLIDRDDVFQMLALRQIRDGDLAADDHDVALRVGLAGDAALAILPQAGVQDGVGNGVANFIRMTFADGFGSKNEASEHGIKESGFRIQG